VTNSKIETLTGDELNDYVNLQWIVIYGSLISHIPGNFFFQTPQVFYINFNYNKIKSIANYVLSKIIEVKQIAMTRNICVDRNFGDIRTFNKFLELNCIELEETTIFGSIEVNSSAEMEKIEDEMGTTEIFVDVTSSIENQTEYAENLSTLSDNENFQTEITNTLPSSFPETSTIETENNSTKLSTFSSTLHPTTKLPTSQTSTKVSDSTTKSSEITQSTTCPANVPSKQTVEDEEEACDFYKINAKLERTIEKYLELSTRPCDI
jgi:hypothetical protein